MSSIPERLVGAERQSGDLVLFSGSLEMDSPSQPVNNHHMHSHITAESKLLHALSSAS